MSVVAAPSSRVAVGVAGVSPLARLGAALLVAVLLVLTIDPVSAGTALVLELLLAPWSGLRPRRVLRRMAPIALAAVLAAVAIALYGRAAGTVRWHWLLVEVTDGSLVLALATLLRILAIGLPAVLLFTDVDATALADGLAQRLRLPARFVIGSLAALRLAGLFRDDLRALELARRARGVADRGRLRRLASAGFALLVLSLRRGSALATAMEARGFGGRGPRTWARPAPWGGPEWALLAIAAAVGVVAGGAAVATGWWTFVVR